MQELRIGICGCTNAYHGMFKGKIISVRRLKNFEIKPEINFKIREVVIPEEHQQQALLKERVHFFIDAHSLFGHTETFINLMEYVPRKYGFVKLSRLLTLYKINPDFKICRAIKRLITPTRWKKDKFPFVTGWNFGKRWNFKKLSESDILEHIKETFERMEQLHFYRWLLHLTPELNLQDLESHALVNRSLAKQHRKEKLKEYHCLPHCDSYC